MTITKSKVPTKDGRAWYFRVCYKDEFNNNQRYQSKKYLTKAEAKEAEAEYINKQKNNPITAPEKMTIKDLWDSFLSYQDDKVRISTKVGYGYTEKHFKKLFDIKCVDYNIHHYEAWKKVMNKKNMKDVSKNDALKTLKALLHYGVKIYNFNFNQTLALMEKFKSPGEVKKEQAFYTFSEFEKFISGEDDPRYLLLWKTLYYCGLRIGEARGLQWKDIDWKKRTLWVNKQVQSIKNYSASYYICDTKTSSSNRKIPMCYDLYESMKEYYNSLKKYKNFNDEFFCFGNDCGITPISHPQAQRRKKVVAEKVGIKEIRLHDFRHSCASLLINSGAQVTMVSKYLGHSDMNETLNTYSHMFDSALDSVVDVINNLKKKA